MGLPILFRSSSSSTTTVTPDVGALTLTAFAPIVAIAAAPGTGALVAAGQSPVVAIGVSPATGALALTGQPPGLAATVPASTGALTMAGQEPAIVVVVPTDTGALALTGAAPALETRVGPGVGALALEAQAPSTVVGTSVLPGVGELGVTGLAPSLEISIATGTGALALDGLAPELTGADVPLPHGRGGSSLPEPRVLPWRRREALHVVDEVGISDAVKNPPGGRETGTDIRVVDSLPQSREEIGTPIAADVINSAKNDDMLPAPAAEDTVSPEPPLIAPEPAISEWRNVATSEHEPSMREHSAAVPPHPAHAQESRAALTAPHETVSANGIPVVVVDPAIAAELGLSDEELIALLVAITSPVPTPGRNRVRAAPRT